MKVVILSAIIFAVIASSTAYAQTQLYSGWSKSTQSSNPSYTSFVSDDNSPAHGDKFGVVSGDVAEWEARSQNYDAVQYTVHVIYSGSAIRSGDTTYTVPAYSTTGSNWITANVINSNMGSISEQHMYQSGSIKHYTVYNNTQMYINI